MISDEIKNAPPEAFFIGGSAAVAAAPTGGPEVFTTTAPAAATPPGDDDEAAWNRDAELRESFGNNKAGFLAFQRANARGLVKIFRPKAV